jgi:hypothetical protein
MKSTRQQNGFLQFMQGKRVVAEFSTPAPQSYGWLRHYWKDGSLTLKGLKMAIKKICNG